MTTALDSSLNLNQSQFVNLSITYFKWQFPKFVKVAIKYTWLVFWLKQAKYFVWFVCLLFITNRFHVAVFSNIKEDVKMWQEHQWHTWLFPGVPPFFVLTTLIFDVTCDLLLNCFNQKTSQAYLIPTLTNFGKWNLFVKYNERWYLIHNKINVNLI